MADEPDYDPVTCPAEDCSYSDAPRSVAAHVSGTHDDRHDWDRLPHDGARAFVLAEKRRQLEARGETVPGERDGTTDGPPAQADAGTARDDGSSGADAGPATGTADIGAEAADDESAALDATFADDAVAVLSLLDRYGTADLADLGTFRLVNLYALLSALSSSADDAREQVRDELIAEIQDDRKVTADFGAVNRYSYESRRLKDDATVRSALERAGVDPVDVMSLDKGKVEDAVAEGRLDADAVFDADERTRIQRIDVDEDRRDELLADLDQSVRRLLETG